MANRRANFACFAPAPEAVARRLLQCIPRREVEGGSERGPLGELEPNLFAIDGEREDEGVD